MFKKTNIFIIWAALGLIFSSPVAADKTVEDFQVWGAITALGNFGAINPNNPDLKKIQMVDGRTGTFW